MHTIKRTFLVLAVFFFVAIFLAGYVRQAEAVRPYSDIKVILYMTDWCNYCIQSREYIQSIGVQLIEHNIERDKEKAWESIEKSGRRGVPVIDVEGIIINGYVPEQIKGAVEMKRNQ